MLVSLFIIILIYCFTMNGKENAKIVHFCQRKDYPEIIAIHEFF